MRIGNSPATCPWRIGDSSIEVPHMAPREFLLFGDMVRPVCLLSWDTWTLLWQDVNLKIISHVRSWPIFHERSECASRDSLPQSWIAWYACLLLFAMAHPFFFWRQRARRCRLDVKYKRSGGKLHGGVGLWLRPLLWLCLGTCASC